jgi:hypothetical protein
LDQVQASLKAITLNEKSQLADELGVREDFSQA